jgi:2-polyprenyl-3-methyl-5-hydroxy-6-metoxy-1,4-benzoquinol methylase
VVRSGTGLLVSEKNHRKWFASLLNEKHSLAFIIEVTTEAVGHLRFDLKEGGECVITVYLLESHTGRGYGIEAILKGCKLAAQRWPDVKFIAEVRPDNRPAIAAFLKAGFKRINTEAESICGLIRLCKAANLIAEEHTQDHYKNLFDIHGPNHLALNWGSKYTQNLRFSILSELGDLKGCSILDVGSGLGDFAGWLDKRGLDLNYVGIDLTEVFVGEAQRKYPGKRFVHGSIMDPEVFRGEEFDFVVASGIFATYENEGSSWMKRVISRMWSLARYGIAFNSLSSWAQDPDETEYYADPSQIFDFCRSLTPWIRLRHDYHPRDFTVFLYRECAV